MKPGLHVGQTAELEITVTPEMVASFEGKVVHELYSTAALIHHMEWAARRTIVPYLEAHEEGMGYHVDVHHTMFTRVGMNVRIRARVSAIRDSKVECEVEAFNWRGKVAKGIVVQSIIQKSWLKNKMHEMGVVEGIVRERALQEQRPSKR